MVGYETAYWVRLTLSNVGMFPNESRPREITDLTLLEQKKISSEKFRSTDYYCHGAYDGMITEVKEVEENAAVSMAVTPLAYRKI